MLSLYITVSPRRLQYRWQCHWPETCCCKFVFFVEVLIRTSQNNRPRLTRRSIPQLFEEDCPHLDSPGDSHVITTQCQAQRRAVACLMLHMFAIHTLYKSKLKKKKNYLSISSCMNSFPWTSQDKIRRHWTEADCCKPAFFV